MDGPACFRSRRWRFGSGRWKGRNPNGSLRVDTGTPKGFWFKFFVMLEFNFQGTLSLARPALESERVR